ncbi:polyprenol monophosphomannose synthase [bacterium]|nr:MAG: polyprenol monophosphomannose synthase [bacterium]
MNKKVVVIPTYNEIKNISKLILELLSLDGNFDILVVDDNSPDGTGQEVERLSGLHKEVNILHRPGKLGMGRAYIDGFKWALMRNYELICEMDADFSHSPRDLLRLLDAINDSDLCIGSRYIENGGVVNWPVWRQVLSRTANLYTRLVTSMPVKDVTSGFKCFRRRVLESISLDKIRSEGYSFQIEMHYKVLKKGFNVKEIPIIFVDRQHGKSKISKKIIIEAFFTVWKLVFSKNED